MSQANKGNEYRYLLLRKAGDLNNSERTKGHADRPADRTWSRAVQALLTLPCRRRNEIQMVSFAAGDEPMPAQPTDKSSRHERRQCPAEGGLRR